MHDVPHTVSVCNDPLRDIADDLHISMAMRRKATAWRHLIVIEHPQCRHAHVPWIIILAKGKGVAAVEPAQIREATLSALA